MAYANISQMIARFGERELTELTDFTGAGEADAAALQSALDDAAALIDAELRAAGYAVPLALPPREIQRANLLLARCELYVTNLPESILAQCQETRAWLRAVAAGTSAHYTHLRAHETRRKLVCRLLLEKKKQKST